MNVIRTVGTHTYNVLAKQSCLRFTYMLFFMDVESFVPHCLFQDEFHVYI